MARILVIDDDNGVRVILGQMLKSAAHETILAIDGTEGMRLYRTRPADLVIIDLIMPNQNGLDTIIQLRKEFPGVLIIVMSGKPVRGTLLPIAQRLGAVGILEKPFSSKQLLEAVEEAL
ncbi:MAG TPA: response regulator [Candidatus Binatia bacterium]|jgi:DNA-binding NtrC family response regulator|nr:response regulator [Candidatus Binatia bacterium]